MSGVADLLTDVCSSGRTRLKTRVPLLNDKGLPAIQGTLRSILCSELGVPLVIPGCWSFKNALGSLLFLVFVNIPEAMLLDGQVAVPLGHFSCLLVHWAITQIPPALTGLTLLY